MRLLFFLAFGIAALWAGGFLLFLERIPRAVTPIETEAAAAIVSLTGGSGRVKEAIVLLQENKAPRLLISGVGEGITIDQILKENDVSESSVAQDKIILGYEARNTAGNAEETALWAKDNDVDSIILVTAHYHMPRARLEFRHSAPDLIIIPHPVFPEEVQMDNLWADPQTLSFLIKEYHKFIMVWQGTTAPNVAG